MGNDDLLYKNKYRIPSARLKGWDYSSSGWYYITICTKDRECLFGEIKDREMRLNHLGEIIRDEWEKSFQIRKELICDTYIIMPNHIHGLIGIVMEDTLVDNMPVGAKTHGMSGAPDNAGTPDTTFVETHGRASLRGRIPGRPTAPIPEMPQRMSRSISSFVAGFKSVATKRINEIRETPGEAVWQTRFYDRIIRDEREFYAVQRYIEENPMRWWLKQKE